MWRSLHGLACRCDANSKFGLLPYPALSANTSQRLSTIKFFLNALGGDVSLRSCISKSAPAHCCKCRLKAPRLPAPLDLKQAGMDLDCTLVTRCLYTSDAGSQPVLNTADGASGRVVHRLHPVDRQQLCVLQPGVHTSIEIAWSALSVQPEHLVEQRSHAARPLSCRVPFPQRLRC